MFDFITADSFDIEKTNQYKLSIQVSLDGFSFLVEQPSDKIIVACKNTPLNISSEDLIARHLKEWIETEELFRNQFNEVKVFIFTEKFTLIPDEFDSNEYSSDLMSVMFDVDTEILQVNKIENLNAHLIFPVQKEIIDVLQPFFPDAKCFHPVSAFLRFPLHLNKKNTSVVIIFKKHFYLIVNRNNKLLMANTFQFSHQNDLVYNVLNTFPQIETARIDTHLFVAGAVSDSNEIVRLLQPYFENIGLLKIDELVLNPEINNNRLLLYLTQN